MQHIGYIMDGNRTWAKTHNLPSLEWHRKGYETAKKIIIATKHMSIPYASFWALSDDNIKKRSPEEVDYLFSLLTRWILDIAKAATKENIRIICIGDRSLLPDRCVKNMKKAELMTENNSAMTAIIAIGYGGQEEIARAVTALMADIWKVDTITTDDILWYLETGRFPPIDLIIRTGGHMRHSGFFLFQSPYTEYAFIEKNWPDFSEADIKEAIEWFQVRERKYGK